MCAGWVGVVIIMLFQKVHQSKKQKKKVHTFGIAPNISALIKF